MINTEAPGVSKGLSCGSTLSAASPSHVVYGVVQARIVTASPFTGLP